MARLRTIGTWPLNICITVSAPWHYVSFESLPAWSLQSRMGSHTSLRCSALLSQRTGQPSPKEESDEKAPSGMNDSCHHSFPPLKLLLPSFSPAPRCTTTTVAQAALSSWTLPARLGDATRVDQSNLTISALFQTTGRIWDAWDDVTAHGVVSVTCAAGREPRSSQ